MSIIKQGSDIRSKIVRFTTVQNKMVTGLTFIHDVGYLSNF